MPMTFQTLQTAITTILGTAAAGRWTTEGYMRQTIAAVESLNSLRHVTVVYGSGAFDKSKSPIVQGPHHHDMSYRVQLLVAADAKVDLATLNDPESTPAERAASLVAAEAAAVRANTLLDELIAGVWDTLMAPANYDLGQAKGVVTDRWIGNIRKSDHPEKVGQYAVLTGSMDLTCAGLEIATGVVPVAGQSIDLSVGVTGDVSGAAYDPGLQGMEDTEPPPPP